MITIPTMETVRALEAAVKKGKLLIIPNRDLPLPPTLPLDVEVLLTEFLTLKTCCLALHM